jgi:hypothetical protein
VGLYVAEFGGRSSDLLLVIEPSMTELVKLAYLAAVSNSLALLSSVAAHKIYKTLHQLRFRAHLYKTFIPLGLVPLWHQMCFMSKINFAVN